MRCRFPTPPLWCLFLPDDVPTLELGRLGQLSPGGARGACVSVVWYSPCRGSADQGFGEHDGDGRAGLRSIVTAVDAVRYCLVCAATVRCRGLIGHGPGDRDDREQAMDRICYNAGYLRL